MKFQYDSPPSNSIFKRVGICKLLHPQTKGQIKQLKNFWTRRHLPQWVFFTGRLRPLFGYECHSWKAMCPNLFGQLRHCDPYPYRGGGRGTKPSCRIPLFLLGNPGIVIQPLKWNCKVTFLNTPWALVRKYLRLAPPEAAQFLEGCHPKHMCCFSRKYLIFICLPMTWNDEEY